MNECDRDELAAITNEPGDRRADLSAADNSRDDSELNDLLPVIEMLDRAGARMGRAGARHAGAPFDPDVAGLLGDFAIVRVIGRGGMGVVYEAIQKSLNRRVALKILPAAFADDPRKVKRFLIEAQAAAGLQHAHIVPVYLVATENGLHYYAMQFIEGRTLAEIISTASRDREAALPGALPPNSGELLESRLPVESSFAPRKNILSRSERRPSNALSRSERQQMSPASAEIASSRAAAELGRQAALALHFAHEHGIMHRDIKPSNLLIDDSGWLWVSDFGLARIAGQSELTLSGAVLGTLRYMSPEQAFGTRVVDHRADVYSLGATIYELITLRPIFEGEDRLELLRRIADEEPRSPRRIDPTIPRDLETIVLKALAKDLGLRYSTARDLAGDLGRFLENRPILARPPGAIDRAAKWVRRHRPAAAAAAIVLLLVVMGLGGAALWRNGELRRHHNELSSALARAEEHESATRQLLYDSQVSLAHQSLASGHVEFAQEILEGIKPEPSRRDPRGFEWHYLRRLCHRDVSLLSRRERLTTAIAVAPDCKMLVTGHADGVIVFWDLALEREHTRVQAHTQPVSKLLFSPNGQVLTSAANAARGPSQVTLWDLRTARKLASLPPITGSTRNLAFAARGDVLLLLEHDVNGDVSKNELVFWDLTRGPQRPVPGAAPVACSRMACAANGPWLATSATSGTVTVRDVRNGRAMKTLPRSFDWILELEASSDGRTLAVADGTMITIWDMGTERELGSVAVPSAGPLTFSPDGNRLACRADDIKAVVLIKDARINPRQLPLERASGQLAPTAFSPDGRMLAGEAIGRVVTLWDTTSGQTLAQFTRETRDLGCLVFTPGAESLIITTELGPIRSWHFAKEFESIAQLVGHKAEVWGVAYSPDGGAIISSGDDHLIKLWDARNGELRKTLKGHTALVASVAVSPDSKLLATAGFEGEVRLWELPDGRLRFVLRGHTDRVRAWRSPPTGDSLHRPAQTRPCASGMRQAVSRSWSLTGTAMWSARSHSTAQARSLSRRVMTGQFGASRSREVGRRFLCGVLNRIRPWRSHPTALFWRRGTTGETSRLGMSPRCRPEDRRRDLMPESWAFHFRPMVGRSRRRVMMGRSVSGTHLPAG